MNKDTKIMQVWFVNSYKSWWVVYQQLIWKITLIYHHSLLSYILRLVVDACKTGGTIPIIKPNNNICQNPKTDWITYKICVC